MMDIDPTQASSNWLFDYGIMEDISGVFPGPPPAGIHFGWPTPPLYSSPNSSGEIGCLILDSEGFKEGGSRKRIRADSCNTSGSKACREKLRRDRLNEMFLELGSILDPGRPSKTDKTSILIDTVRLLTQLRTQSKKLQEANDDLQDKIKELKTEKNELRDEKQRIKAEKERLEQQVKALSMQPGFLPHASASGAAYSAQDQSAGNKFMPFVGYPGVAMWQFMPPAVVDTSQDHVLRPPVA